jgi:hypothetical protein
MLDPQGIPKGIIIMGQYLRNNLLGELKIIQILTDFSGVANFTKESGLEPEHVLSPPSSGFPVLDAMDNNDIFADEISTLSTPEATQSIFLDSPALGIPHWNDEKYKLTISPDHVTSLDATMKFRTYFVWQFEDQTVLPLNAIDWHVKFKLRSHQIGATGYFTTDLDPESNIYIDLFTYTHLQPGGLSGPVARDFFANPWTYKP